MRAAPKKLKSSQSTMTDFLKTYRWTTARREREGIVLRVEAEFRDRSRSTPGFDDHQNLQSRDDRRNVRSHNSPCSPTEEAAYLHLTWSRHWPGITQPFESPFISLFTSYRSALRRKSWFLQRGARTVNILAYDVSRDETMLDALRLARHFAQRESVLPWMWRRIEQRNHGTEVLSTRGLFADDYNLLAVFPSTTDHEISLTTSRGTVKFPSEYWWQNSLAPDPFDALRSEVYMHTGKWDDLRTQKLFRALMGA